MSIIRKQLVEALESKQPNKFLGVKITFDWGHYDKYRLEFFWSDKLFREMKIEDTDDRVVYSTAFPFVKSKAYVEINNLLQRLQKKQKRANVYFHQDFTQSVKDEEDSFSKIYTDAIGEIY